MSSPEDFGVELRRWRDVRGMSQARLGALMDYDRTYISKVESGSEPATAAFAQKAEQALQAGGALVGAAPAHSRRPPADSGEPATTIVVEHDEATLTYDGHTYTARQRRTIRNCGLEPITQYLMRISVDRYPGDAERSNALYREQPLSWDGLDLRAEHATGGPMAWRVLHDRDAVKEIWLLFEGERGRFPLYPGDAATIEYSYRVPDTQWGHWFQRAVRLPTKRLDVHLDFPTDLAPVVWGQETTMTAAALPLRTAIARRDVDGRTLFDWSTDQPPLHARYRLEWSFRERDEPRDGDVMPGQTATDTMRALGIAQDDDPILHRPARPLALPQEAEDARRLVAQLQATMERVAAVHDFSKGMGIAAPQIGIDRAAAVVRTPVGDQITLLNPRIIDESDDWDEQYEGCLSFFDVRGMVCSPLRIDVEHQDVTGQLRITTFDRGVARLVRHEVDHLMGSLYTARMRPGVEPIPVSEYRGTGQGWRY